jgi:hypothetical protein
VFSWLFALIWVECLFRFAEGKCAALLVLPPLMLVWVNLHGGWVLGLVLLAIFAVEPARKMDRQALLWLGAVLAGCLVATLLSPYGYRLPVHVYQYLSDSLLMDSIDEFRSPDFHQPVYLYFAAFLPLSLACMLLGRARLTLTDVLLWLFSLHAGLYAARNVPIAAILLSIVLGPLMAHSHSQVRLLDAVNEISDSMLQLDRQLRGHALAITVTAACVGILLHGGRLFPHPVMNAHFNERVYPVNAATFVAQAGIHDRLFTSDSWGAYLIYRLYPATRVYFDDRHDFYGPAFVKEYGMAVLGTRLWQQPLDRHQVRWVLMPVDAPLSSLLRTSSGWRPVFDDGVAILFARKPL